MILCATFFCQNYAFNGNNYWKSVLKINDKEWWKAFKSIQQLGWNREKAQGNETMKQSRKKYQPLPYNDFSVIFPFCY